ncbi:transcriptional elongation factor Iws1, putative [Talaromyces stipitatus ATCC 10500]|uniref:Transcriptional elongation factor Iws1, putative n=1 Tax=Talaromyces stipitatus (strain ATCC 10500 / CBS 375.48 / QM 6759 / NRRL 1006) TaxID=441959 RepID=B8MK11_TALSN|nr:transcriptional elongation factor Iws1, putative [Talaromyces stipitatus ATCC 10500]EED14828.1 transcriptional elongation factor Iws1, putative [Talaromyces stipitatus ATCC 10500]
MSASPEPQADSPAADPDRAELQAELDDLNDNNGGATEENPEISDDESVLSEVDEAQFEDFNPDDVAIEDRPALDVDAENLKLIGRHKRKRRDDEEGEPKRKREGRREKRKRAQRDSDVESGDAKAGRRKAAKSRREATPEDEETLSPEERRRRALDRAMDAAMKQKTRRRRKADGIDLEQMADAEIEDMRRRMTDAARLDAEARRQGQPAMHKLKMLPEVLNLLNRNQYTASLVDPEINLLEAVKFFLEPLDDGELPAYNIQRDLMDVLGKLPINKDSLVASGIGKVIVFYTKSKRPELKIKRQAERLLADWTRPILQRSDDYSKRVYEEVEFDPTRLVNRANIAQQTAEEARARELLPPRLANRARREMGHTSYSIVPRSTVIQDNKFARPVGASGEDRFRRMKARQLNAGKPSRR